MSLVCRQCSRVNPDEAYYCYFDGAALAGRAASAGPINLGAQPFPSPFVFPSGAVCRNFDQLAMACQQHWEEAAGALGEGHFGAFFSGLGRADLARAARDAAAFPDRNRGLDQLLGKLPTRTLEPPKLRVEPTEISLGQLKIGVDRKLDLALENQGMRLVFGEVASDVPWLTLAGHSSKNFELTDEMTIPIEVVGKNLRARLKPQEGRLVIESNAGNFLITIRIEVPPTPFTEGVLAGALSPRQIAERAKANPAAAAPLFEAGAVSRWFADNGLVYPVRGPTAPGIAGVQQFFEALGLAKPPKVEFSPKPIEVEGDPGQVFEFPLAVTTQDKKLVYAYATADQSWVEGTNVQPSGRSCGIQLKVTLPPTPGESRRAKVTVHGNGDQRFSFTVTATVRGAANRRKDDFPLHDTTSRRRKTEVGGSEIAFDPASPLKRFERPPSRWLAHLAPAVALVTLLAAIVLRDYYSAGAADDVDHRERLGLSIDWPTKGQKKAGNSLMFGLVDRTELPERPLIHNLGQNNSAVLQIDGRTRVFGQIQHGKLESPLVAYKDKSRVVAWRFANEGVVVTQHVQLIPGEPIEQADGVFKRFYDTCLARYTIVNNDVRPHTVGFRLLLDTYIGTNDKPLFAIPGRSGIVRSAVDLHGSEVPDFIQALEFPDLKNPGTIAQLNLKLGGRLEMPSRVSLTNFPGWNEKFQYEIPVAASKSEPPPIKDSAIALYWKPMTLAAGESRDLGFTYGLGDVGGLAELTILNPGPIVQGSEFSVVALVADAGKGTEAEITLPAGLELAPTSKAKIELSPAARDDAGDPQPSPATWTVRAPLAGRYTISVTANGFTTHRVVTVRKASIF